MKVRLAPAAEADLAHIRDTILFANPVAAERVQRSIAIEDGEFAVLRIYHGAQNRP